jgi:hypothetical protein
MMCIGNQGCNNIIDGGSGVAKMQCKLSRIVKDENACFYSSPSIREGVLLDILGHIYKSERAHLRIFPDSLSLPNMGLLHIYYYVLTYMEYTI